MQASIEYHFLTCYILFVMTSGETSDEVPAITQSSKEVAGTSGAALESGKEAGMLRDLLLSAKPMLVKEADLEACPEGVQMRVMGPKVHVATRGEYDQIPRGTHLSHTHELDGTLGVAPDLGMFNIMPGTQPGNITIEYYPLQEGGKPFLIDIGEDTVNVTSEVSAREIREVLAVLLRNGEGPKRFDDSTIHFADAKSNLEFLNRDGTPREKTEERDTDLIEERTRSELPPGTENGD